MKKFLSILLCLSMFVSVFCVSASAKSPVNIFNVTVEVPQVGNKPDYNAYVPSTASTKVVNVEWKGELDNKSVDILPYNAVYDYQIADDLDLQHLFFIHDTIRSQEVKQCISD